MTDEQIEWLKLFKYASERANHEAAELAKLARLAKLPTAAHYYKTVTASSHLVTMGSRLRDYPAPTGPTWLCEQATPEQCFWPSNP